MIGLQFICGPFCLVNNPIPVYFDMRKQINYAEIVMEIHDFDPIFLRYLEAKSVEAE